MSLSRQLVSLSAHHTDTDTDSNAAGPEARDADEVKRLSFYLPHGTSKVIHIDR